MSFDKKSLSELDKSFNSFIKTPTTEAFHSLYEISENKSFVEIPHWRSKKFAKALKKYCEKYLQQLVQRAISLRRNDGNLQDLLVFLNQAIGEKVYKAEELGKILDMLFEIIKIVLYNDSGVNFAVARSGVLVVSTIKSIVLLFTSESVSKKASGHLIKLFHGVIRPEYIAISLFPVEIQEKFTNVLLGIIDCYHVCISNENIEEIKYIYANVLDLVQANPDLINTQNSPSAVVFIEKFLKVLEIITSMVKADAFFMSFVENFEKFSEVFNSAVKFFCTFEGFSDNMMFVCSDKIVGRLFAVVFQVFLAFGVDSSFALPVRLFSAVISEVDKFEGESEGLIVMKRYLLEFLFRFYCENCKSHKSMSGEGLEKLLFSKFLFEIDDEVLVEQWESLWKVACKDRSNLESVCGLIVENLKLRMNDLKYFYTFNQWVNSTDQQILQSLIDFGLIKSLILLISEENLEINSAIILFQLAKYLLPLNTCHNKKIFTILLYDIIKKHDKYLEFCTEILAILLNKSCLRSLEIFLDFFTENFSTEIEKCLVKSITFALRDKSQSVFLNNFLISQNFPVILQKTIKKNEGNLIVWRQVFECLEMFEANNQENVNFNYWEAVWTMRNPEYLVIRKEIILQTLEILLNIVTEKNSSEIRTPQALPLLIEYLCDPCIGEDLLRVITDIIDFSSNLKIFAKNGLVSIILYHLEKGSLAGNLGTFWEIIRKTVKIGVSLVDFAGIVREMCGERKRNMLDVVKNALAGADAVKNIGELMVFGKKQGICMEFGEDGIGMNENFTVSMWFMLNSKNGNLIRIEFSIDKLIICIKDSVLSLKINGKTIFQVKSLKRNMWTFIAISFTSKKVAKVLSKSYLTFYFWSQDLQSTQMTKSNLSKKNKIFQIIFGNYQSTIEKSDIALIPCMIFKKKLEEKELIFLQNLGPVASLFAANAVDFKLLGELKDLLVFSADTSSLWGKSLISPNKNQFVLRYSHIVENIRIYNPKKLLVELTYAATEITDLIRVYEIFNKILNTGILDKVFFQYLGFVINSKMIDNKIHDIYWMMIENTPKKFSKILFRAYTENHKCTFLMGKSKNLDVFAERYLRVFPFSRANFYKLCMILTGLDYNLSVKTLEIYIRGSIKGSIREEIAFVLYSLLHLKNFSIIKAILEVLANYPYTPTSKSHFTTILLYIIEHIPVGQTQILIIKILFLSETENSETDSEEIQKLLTVLFSLIPDKVNHELLSFFAEIGFKSEKTKQNIRKTFIDILMTQLKTIENSEILTSLISKICENKWKIYQYVYSRDIFPFWLVSCFKNSEFKKEIEGLGIFILSTVASQSNMTLDKISEFFNELPKIKLYAKIFESTSFPDMENINSYFMILFSFPKLYIFQNIDYFVKLMLRLLDSDNFVKFLVESISLNSLVKKVNLLSLEKPKSRKKNLFQFLVGQYTKFSIKLLKIAPTNPGTLSIFSKFLSHPSINYFNIHESEPSAKNTHFKAYISIYIFHYLLNVYEKYPEIYKNFLVEFAANSRIFEKLLIIMRENSKDSIFQALCLTDKTALLGKSNLITLSTEDASQNISVKEVQEIDDDYQSLCETSEKLHSQIVNNPENILGILSQRSPNWLLLHEKFNQMVKNYNKIDKNPSFYSSNSPQPPENSIFPDFRCIIDSLERDPWEQIYFQSEQRKYYKLKYDYNNFKKILEKSQRALEKPLGKNVTIRQNYDNFYRWVFLKPLKESKEAKLLPQHLIPKQEIGFKLREYDSNSEESSCSPLLILQNKDFSSAGLKECVNIQAEYIKVQASYLGQLIATSKFIEFSSNGEKKNFNNEVVEGALEYTCESKIILHIWKAKDINEIILRRFIHNHTAFEIILVSGKSYFFNVYTPESRKDFLKVISTWKIKITGKDPKLEIEAYQTDWKKGVICNFEYLMILNKLSSRSANDISQYPVFPWVITDYSKAPSPFVPEVFRKFLWPIGGQTEESQKNVQKKYQAWSEEDLDPFHYGSHYSSGGVALHFLMRLEPFTSQAKSLQGGSLDVGDRLFISIDLAWDSVEGSNGDVKELIPELFYQPFCLYSFEKTNYGVTQTGESISDIIPPIWATSNWDFLKKHRMALESNIASKDLHNWIDLIFGYKQQGHAAVNTFNVFCSVTYENLFQKLVSSQTSKDARCTMEQAYHFGQTPICIFGKKPHPHREEIGQNYTFDMFFEKENKNDLEFVVDAKEIAQKGESQAVFLLDTTLLVVKSLEDKFYLSKYVFKLTNNANFTSKTHLLQYLPVTFFQSYIPDLQRTSPYTPPKYSPNSFAVYKKKYLISAFHSSNSLVFHNFKGQLIKTLPYHTNLISCIATTSELIFSSSLDSSIASFKLDESLSLLKTNFFSGHTSAVNNLKALESYCIIVSSSFDRVLIHDVRTGECLKKIGENCRSLDVCEIGILALACHGFVKYFGFNGELISQFETSGNVSKVVFNFFGDYCLEVSENEICIRDPTDIKKNSVIKIEGVQDLIVHPLEKCLISCINVHGDTAVYQIKLVSKAFIKERNKMVVDLL